MRPIVLLCAALLTLPLASVASQGSAPSVVLESLSGATERRPLAEFDLARATAPDTLFVRPQGLPRGETLVGADVAWLRLHGDGQHGGDHVRAHVRGGAEDLLRVELFDTADWVVSVDRIAELVFRERISAEVLAGLEPAESGDLLFWIREGGGLDRVPGTLLEFGAEGPRLESSFGERTYPWGEIAALFVEALDEGTPHEAVGSDPGLRVGAVVGVDLVDGGRLFGVLEALDAEVCRIATAPGREVELPLWSVAEVAVDDGRARYLSELDPIRAREGSAFGDDLGLTWHHRRDRAVTGGPLRAGGRVWRRGLGVHAPSELTWELGGTWTSLRGSVAIDDEVLLLAARGSVVFRVQVDGDVRFESDIVRGGRPPLSLPPIDLRGARELTLEVDMSDEHFVADRANWLGLLLVREP